MTTVGVTGADGFFGWHMLCRLRTFGWRLEVANRATFADESALDAFVQACDVIVHLAGVNRAATDLEVHEGNVVLAERLVAAQNRTGSYADIVYANSVKASEGGAYGDSKALAADQLATATTHAGRNFVDIRFPHLFGEFGVPLYNSAVTTFAHQLAHHEPSDVSDGYLELLHVQDAAQLVLDSITQEVDGQITPGGSKISVIDCYEKMRSMADAYASGGMVPFIGDDMLRLRLFNTIRSQMWPEAYPMDLTRHADERGAFFEVVRACGQGQTSISTTVPGVTRGEHYHLDKIERFAVISGEAMIRVRRLFTDQIIEFSVTGSEPVVIDMPTLCTHDITNTGSGDLVTLFWSHDHFDPDNADTWSLPVEREGINA